MICKQQADDLAEISFEDALRELENIVAPLERWMCRSTTRLPLNAARR